MTPAGPAIHFLNVEYFFRLLYDTFFTAHVSGGGIGGNLGAAIILFFTHLWFFVIIIGSIVSIGALILLIHSTMRMMQVEADDAPRYATTDAAHAVTAVEHHRWMHVMELIESKNESDWRQAIIEADIILDDMLNRLGFVGDSIGDKLKQASPDHFHTLQDAWEAHKVRNEIAHQGSGYPLSDHIAYRTIKQYENVFREHNEI